MSGISLWYVVGNRRQRKLQNEMDGRLSNQAIFGRYNDSLYET